MSAFTDKLAKSLVDCGIQYAFGVAGSGSSLELITALEKLGVKYYPVAHEAAGVLMAGACSREGKTKAVMITIKGPGFANALPGIVSNFYENRPALTISEAYAPTVTANKTHKRLNHFLMASPVLKGFAEGEVNGDIFRKLIEIGELEVPGPIHIDLFQGEAVFRKEGLKTIISPPDEDKINKIFEALKKSKKPIIILGSYAARNFLNKDWSLFNIPVLTTAAAKGAINENSPYAGGVITGEIKELSPETVLVSKSDLVIGIGLRNTEVINAQKFGAILVNFDVVPGLSGGFDPDFEIIADTERIEKEIAGFEKTIRQNSWGADEIARWHAALEKELFFDKWLPAVVFKKMQEIMPDSTLVLDTGFFCTIGETVWHAKKTENFLGSSNGRFMGTAYPTAIGAAISSEHQVIAVAGDGGARDYLSEIKLAVEKKLPIIFVLMSDGSYGSVASTGRAKNLSADAFDIKNPSWHKAVAGMGCDSREIKSVKELESVLNGREKDKKPLFLELPFEKELYQKMTDKLR